MDGRRTQIAMRVGAEGDTEIAAPLEIVAHFASTALALHDPLAHFRSLGTADVDGRLTTGATRFACA
jgi:hypothetical protein